MLPLVQPSEHYRCSLHGSTERHVAAVRARMHCRALLNTPRQLVPSRSVSLTPRASTSDMGLNYTDAGTSFDTGSSLNSLQPTAVQEDTAATAPGRRRRDPSGRIDSARTLPSMFTREISPRRHKRVDYAPGARVGESVELLLARQLRDLMKNPIPGVSVAPDENNIMIWEVLLAGPEGSPYAGGWFEVQLMFTSDFPGKQPYAKFLTKIWHPNVQLDGGHTCVALGEMPGMPSFYDQHPLAGHSRVRSVACVLVGLQMLLSTPNPRSSLNSEAGQQMMRDEGGFRDKARSWTRMYAGK